MKQLDSLFICFIALIAICQQTSAQFTLSAEVRPRAEFRNGFKSPIENGMEPAFFVEQRTRLYADYLSEKFDMVVSLQDIRIWGASAQVYKSDPALSNLYEAYGTYKITSKHSFSAGRMALDYDNARIFGNLDWAQQGRSHDLLKYSYETSFFHLDIGAAFNQDAATPEYSKLSGTFYSGVNNYKTIQYAWVHRQFGKSKMSFLALNNGIQYATDSVYFSQTLGVYVVPQVGPTSLELEFYYQAGKDGSGNTLGAYMLSASWLFHKGKSLSLIAGADVLSGDDPNTGKDEAFTPLFGTNHKFYGFMDYFYVGNGHSNKGLTDLNLKAKFETGEKSTLLAHVHQFFANANIPGEGGRQGDYASNLGTELDIVFNTVLGKGVKFVGGYSQIFQSESMNVIKNQSGTRGMQNWAWAMLVFKPTLFESESKK